MAGRAAMGGEAHEGRVGRRRLIHAGRSRRIGEADAHLLPGRARQQD
jgi:hypothetical protein